MITSRHNVTTITLEERDQERLLALLGRHMARLDEDIATRRTLDLRGQEDEHKQWAEWMGRAVADRAETLSLIVAIGG